MCFCVCVWWSWKCGAREGGWRRTPSPSASETQNRAVQSGSFLRPGQAAMALVVDAAHCMGAYYCLVRTRFKRRRKKRSERKGQNAFFNRPGGDLWSVSTCKTREYAAFSLVCEICICRLIFKLFREVALEMILNCDSFIREEIWENMCDIYQLYVCSFISFV